MDDFSSARPNTKEGASEGAQGMRFVMFRVLHHRFTGCPVPQHMWSLQYPFLKAPLALRSSQAPHHSVTSYAPACAPQVIVYFRCLLESLLDFCSSASRGVTIKGDRIKSGCLTPAT